MQYEHLDYPFCIEHSYFFQPHFIPCHALVISS